jgi:hypothetical protein
LPNSKNKTNLKLAIKCRKVHKKWTFQTHCGGDGGGLGIIMCKFKSLRQEKSALQGKAE